MRRSADRKVAANSFKKGSVVLREFRTLIPYAKRYLPYYLPGFIFLIVTDAGQLFIPQLIKGAINDLSGGSPELPAILRLVMEMVAIAFAVAVGRFGWRFFIQGSSRRIEKELRDRYFSHLIGLSPAFFARYQAGDLMARATNDMNAIRMATGMATVSFVDGLFMTLAILVILFTQYPLLALYTILPLPILSVLMLMVGSLLGDRFRRVQEGFARLSGHVQEALSGIRVIQSFTQEEHSVRTFARVNDEYRDRNMALVKIFGFLWPIMTFLSGLTVLLLLWLGGPSVIAGSMSTGDFVAFMSYLGMLVWPMMGAGYTINLLQRGGASLKRVNAVLSEKPEIVGPPAGARSLGDGSIVIRGLSFAYPAPAPLADPTGGSFGGDGGRAAPALEIAGGDRGQAGRRVLEGITLDIPQGSTLGILGRTGSGKSTLIRLIPRLLDPPPGTVMIGGRDVHEFDLPFLRSSIGMVPQDSFLFSATIRENIAFGVPDLSEEVVRRVAEVSTIDRDLAAFPRGLDTVVGERGVTLSGGQKQRIAISRALAVSPQVLVLDDALSSVDTQTEERILRELMRERQGKTNIIISHRVSTLAVADRIVVIDGGRIVQSGSHEELLSQEGFYAEIHALQRIEQRVR